MNSTNQIVDECFRSDISKMRVLFEKAFRLRKENFPDVIYFYTPGMVHFDMPFHKAINPFRFPAISITGKRCHLGCEHCRGKILESMIPVEKPQNLLDVCLKISKLGGEGCLISGGSLTDGRIPLTKFIPAIKRVKEETKLKIVVHTGLLDSDIAEALAAANIDGAMIDIIGSNETIRKVCHLNGGVKDFEYSLEVLERNHIPAVPHIVVGLHFGRLKGEEEALKIVTKHRIATLVIVVLMPLEGTPMENIAPPSPLDAARVILAARLLMIDTPLLLGCARPKGSYRTRLDVLSIKAGVNGIAYPSEEAYNLAVKLGFRTQFYDECCSLLWEELTTGFRRRSPFEA